MCYGTATTCQSVVDKTEGPGEHLLPNARGQTRRIGAKCGEDARNATCPFRDFPLTWQGIGLNFLGSCVRAAQLVTSYSSTTTSFPRSRSQLPFCSTLR